MTAQEHFDTRYIGVTDAASKVVYDIYKSGYDDGWGEGFKFQWHDATKKMPKEGERVVVETTTGFGYYIAYTEKKFDGTLQWVFQGSKVKVNPKNIIRFMHFKV